MRTDAHITVTCEGCGTRIRILVPEEGWEEKDVQLPIEAHKWLSKDEQDFCPEFQ